MARSNDNQIQAGDIIQRHHDWYNLLFNYANDAIFVYQRTPDGDPGKMLDVNLTACEMLGYSREELLGMTMLDITSPERYANYLTFRKRLDANKHVVTQTVKTTKDGKKIRTELSSHLFEIDGIPTVLSIVRDITDRKKVEGELRDSQHRYYTLLNSAPDGIMLHQLNSEGEPGKIVEANDVLCERLGYTRKELAHLTPWDIVERRLPERISKLREQLLKKEVNHFEMTEKSKDGTTRPVEVTARLLEINRRRYVLSISRDISKRKLIEEELRKSQHRYYTLLDNAYDGILLYKMRNGDEPGRFVEANKAICQRLGYSREEILKLSPLQITYTEESDFMENMRERFRHEGGFTFNHIELTRDGRKVLTETNVKLLEMEDERYVLITSKDISERVNAEKQIRESEERYRSLFDSINDAIIVHDTSSSGLVGKITEVNDTACRMLGRSKKQLIGMTPVELMRPEDRPTKMPPHYQQLMKKGSSFYEIELISAEGRRIPVEINSYLLERQGKLSVVAVIRDISQRIESEQQVREVREKLIRNEKLAALGQMASGIAHDIGTPLTVITNVVDYLKEHLSDADETVKTQLDRLERQASIACNISHDLLDFARVRVPKREEVNINAVVQKAAELVHIPQNIAFTVEHTDESGSIMADENQMIRVFTNMISNAVKSMPDGGSLLVQTRRLDKEVRIAIMDTGVGIPAESLDKIFEPLYTTRAREGSIGIGLAICKSIVEAHGGVIEVESKQDIGTTFTIKLPCSV